MATASTQLTVGMLKTSKNKDKACIDGFLYTLSRFTSTGSRWVCEKRGTYKARLITQDRNVIKPTDMTDIHSTHTHAPDCSRVEMKRGLNTMKHRAMNSIDSTRSILATGLETMTDSTISKLSKFDSIKRTIRRQKCSENFTISALPEEISIPGKFKITLKGQQFLLFDSGIGDVERLLIFGTTQMLALLRDSNSWFADGTFKVVPSQFFQLYTLHCEKDGYIIPCIYALMTNKSEIAYRKLFSKLVELEPELNPTRIMVDFEKAAINALEDQFISVISGCFFHLSQNLYRQIQSKGLTTKYMEEEEFAVQMRMLAALAFVPECDVTDCFVILMAQFPPIAVEIAEYFEINYIGRRLPDQSRRTPPYPIRIWNMFVRVISRTARTNNAVEGWHNAFKSGANCPHPNFIKLLNHLQREQSLQEANVVKWEAGEISSISKSSETKNE